MSEFFINRPVFAWVIAIFIVLLGIIALPQLPIARYPSIAPPTVNISASYPGATTQTMSDSVLAPIERELSGVKNMLYFESAVDTAGTAQITVTFNAGTNPDLAQVDVQNRLKTIEPRLPQAVRQNGLTVESADSGFLLIASLTSSGGKHNELELGDYLARNIVEELRRIQGVGRVQFFGAEQAIRIWVDPAKLISYGLSMSDLSAAIGQQNVQIAPGRIGDAPIISGQKVTVPLTVQGQLQTPEEFADIVLKSTREGAMVVIGDVARVELGAQSYGFTNREDGKPSSGVAIQLAPGANAVKTADAITSRLAELQVSMPADMHLSIPFNNAPFVKISIYKVIYTLIEAMILVFLVMFLFLQKVRYTLIPAIVAPIALLGTLAVMQLSGFSVNVLTMFGMVLAIGIIVDDAIVVVENVERIMAVEGLSAKAATSKAMREISGAVIGITLVLTAVFIPMAFAQGSVGVIYRQFSLSLVVSILFSAFLALSLTPALCATLLKQGDPKQPEKKGFFGWFNKVFAQLTQKYESWISILLCRIARMMLLYIAITGALVWSFRYLPSAFLPEEDQGYFITTFQLPADATQERTLQLVKMYEQHVASRPGIASNTVIMGFGFSGSGPNTAIAFTRLKDWGERGGTSVKNEIMLVQKVMEAAPEGSVMSLSPPAIEDLGTSSGFNLRLQARSGQSYSALTAAETRLVELAAKSHIVAGVYADGLPSAASIALKIDRQKAQAFGVPFSTISDTLTTAIGSLYVNDFPNGGRMQQVVIQADAPARMQLDDVLKLNVRNNSGGMVPLSEFVYPAWTDTPLQLVRYMGYPSVRISGSAAAGISSGEAMAEMERLAAELPSGFTLVWTGESLQEKSSSSQAPLLIAISIFVIFLVLAALYESWSVPLSVLLVVPLGLIGAVAAVMLRDLPNDVFFKVSMITVIGLSAKNAILIIEFAIQLRVKGRGLIEAVVMAARLRLRPILMTSLAFTLGVLPLMLATGASAETQHAIGTGVFGGMVSATFLAIFFVPVFFVCIIGLQQRVVNWRQKGDCDEN
ncbi:MAG: multidrug efflux RND transporter permease subunit [Rouxiella aceris]|uniref:multidrug efflux RND transporter permease subunit n=1 Tax=Rouxiella aceris TaxID=2703884 RepID=UPI00284B789A|nr:multidrug efflux RND transporter permease subunit [Rouxiella aceris]MDR3434314.1 multidrug efflux RND transporter permease subunit [Rouxiella aceris]